MDLKKRLVELAVQLVEAQDEEDVAHKRVEHINGQLDALGGAEVSPTAATTTKEKLRPKRGERLSQVAALVKAGHDTTAIAAELGITAPAARAALMRAVKAGLIPKGERAR